MKDELMIAEMKGVPDSMGMHKGEGFESAGVALGRYSRGGGVWDGH